MKNNFKKFLSVFLVVVMLVGIAPLSGFIAPVEVYPGENELESLAENGYGVLSEEFEIKEYRKL